MGGSWGGFGDIHTSIIYIVYEKSKIYAVDKDKQSLDQISIDSNIELVKMNQDFNDHLHFSEALNGILIANGLHFVQDKTSLLKSLRSFLLPDGRLIIVEYDITKGNQWVPFPIDFMALNALALKAGFKNVVKLAEMPSHYHRSMYSALVS